MRLELSIPDTLYTKAQRAAAAHGISLETYMTDVLNVHLREEKPDSDAVTLTPEQIRKVQAGKSDVLAGRVHTPAEVRKQLQAKHDSWPASQS